MAMGMSVILVGLIGLGIFITCVVLVVWAIADNRRKK